ncbi:hypothetical protein FRC05_008810 [Tulasnella sp. 425]|nr:hypothetical protein FRC05_008810 [Tulasnella sp. 425]
MLKAMKNKGADRITGFMSSAAAGSTTIAAVGSSTAQVTADPQIQEEKQLGTEEPHATQIVTGEDLDASNNEPAYEAYEVCVGFLTKIVGVRYYTVRTQETRALTLNHQVPMVLENWCLWNAIRVLNASGTQVGHIPRTVAAKLAPLMDQGRVSVEGAMKTGILSGRFAYELDMTLNICGPSNPARRRELEPLLIWATPGQQGFPVPGPAQPPNQTGVAGTSLSPKKGQKNASAAAGPSNAASQLRQQQYDALCGEDILELPVHEDPPSKAKCQLKNALPRYKVFVGALNTKVQRCLKRKQLHRYKAGSSGQQRILLDEGHNIRNPKTKTSQAICELVVTGTPIINSPNDLGSLLKFLKVCSLLDQHEYFNRLLGRPLSKADPQAAVLLKALMSSICLRKEMRDKDHKPLVPLPPVGITVVRVALSDEERRLYDDIFHESQRRFEDFLSAGNAMHQPAGDVWTLVRSKDMRNDTNKMLYLQGPPKANNKNDAAAHPPSPALSAEEVDQGVVSEGDLIESPPPSPEDDFEVDEEADYDALDNDEAFKPPPPPPPSSKTQHLISLLQLIPSTEKSLVFSQFTSFLDQIAIQYLAK